MAIGWAPASDDLALDLAGAELTDRGFVRVDDHLRTTAVGRGERALG